MALLYKTFKPFRTVFYVAITLILWGQVPAMAQVGPYTVEGIEIDVSANNALNARNQAFEKAQQEALKQVANNFLTDSQVAAFQPPPGPVISPMIQDYEVTKEKLSKQRYIGTYTIRFKSRAVRQYFDALPRESLVDPATIAAGPPAPDSSVEVFDQASGTVKPIATPTPHGDDKLILPFYQVSGRPVLWSSFNAMMQPWRRATLPSGYALPVGDLSDVEDIGDDQAFSYDRNGLSRILNRYGAGEAIIIIAKPDESLQIATSDEETASGSMTLEFYSDSGDGIRQMGEITIDARPGETRGSFLARSASESISFLREGAPQQTHSEQAMPVASAFSGGPGTVIDMRVSFGNLQEWAEAQRSLARVPGINDVILKSLTPKQARIGVVYNGDADTLRIALQQMGMDLSDAGSGAYELYLHQKSAPQSPAPDPVVNSQMQKPVQQWDMSAPDPVDEAYQTPPGNVGITGPGAVPYSYDTQGYPKHGQQQSYIKSF